MAVAVATEVAVTDDKGSSKTETGLNDSGVARRRNFLNLQLRPIVSDQERLVRFGDYSRPVLFVAADEVLEGFKSLLYDWQIEELPTHAAQDPIIIFSKVKGRYAWASDVFRPPDSDWLTKPPNDPFEAIEDFHYRFLDWHSLENPDHFCLHGAAVKLGEGLVIFPSKKKAGKSTLVLELARLGETVFCDDVLPIDPESWHGIAMGIQPRVRLPIPEVLSAEHKEFIHANLGINDGYHGFLKLEKPLLARPGEMLRVKAIVNLHRDDAVTECALSEASRSQTLSALIDQNYAKHHSPTRIFDQMLELVERVDRNILDFSDVEQAAKLLLEKFG